MNRHLEKSLKRLLLRRLESAKGTVYFEFAIMMPFVMMVVLFAADFMRILYCEQQLEIASRALCDIQCHIEPGAAATDTKAAAKVPDAMAKAPVRKYLASVLGSELMTGDEKSVYCKAEVRPVKTLFEGIVEPIVTFLNGGKDTDSIVVKVLGKILGSVLNFLTFRTDKYFLMPLGRDLMVRASVSAYIKTFAPKWPMKFFGNRDGDILVVPYKVKLDDSVAAFNREVKLDKRDRYYCTMPLMDTLPMAPGTYVRVIKQKLKRFL